MTEPNSFSSIRQYAEHSKASAIEDLLRDISSQAQELFERKANEYSSSWRILRQEAITDQVWIKAYRIRSIQESNEQKVRGEDNSIESEFIGILNYSIMACIQLSTKDTDIDWPADICIAEYAYHRSNIEDLREMKNSDYGASWMDMRLESITDMILSKLLRVKEMQAKGTHGESEPVINSFKDIFNYAVFALAHMWFDKTYK